jgi:hypothetical protein
MSMARLVRQVGIVGPLLLLVACQDFLVGKVTVDDYEISVRYDGTRPSAGITAAIDSAVRRLERIVVTGVDDVQLGSAVEPYDLSRCDSRIPSGRTLIDEEVDDLIVYVHLDTLEGNTIAEAGPCLRRENGYGIPGVGNVWIDTIAIAPFLLSGAADDVILHELLHVLGIGSIVWAKMGLISTTGATAGQYIGVRGVRSCGTVYGASTCIGFVPVEDCLGLPAEWECGAGNIGAHWKESIFDTELQTPFVESMGPQPLSQMTIEALGDIGYVVNTAEADPVVPSFVAMQRAIGDHPPAPIFNPQIRRTLRHRRVLPPRFVILRTGGVVRPLTLNP